MTTTVTPGQQGILYECLASPVPDLYVNQAVWEVDDDLSDVIDRTASILVRRHEVLRVRFDMDDAGAWTQRPFDEPTSVEHHEVTADPDTDPEPLGRALQLMRTACGLRSDGPLTRFALVKVPGRRLLVWTFHHVLLDGWSLDRILREFDALLAAERVGDITHLAPVPSWCRIVEDLTELHSTSVPRDLEHWKQRLSGLPADAFPAAPEQPPTPSGHYHEARFVLDKDRSAVVNKGAREAGVTIATLCAAAVALARNLATLKDLLGSSHRTVMLGNVTAGRPADLPGRDDAVGLLAQVIPCAIALPSAEESVPQWLRGLQSALVGDREHATAPLWDIRQLTAGAGPLFDTGLAVESFQTEDLPSFLRFIPWSWRDSGAVPPASKSNYAYSVAITPGPELDLFVSTAADHVTRADTELFLERVVHALEYLAGEIGPLKASELIPDAERHRVIEHWNATESPYRRDVTLAEWFSAQAEATPDAICVESAGERMTYSELERRSNQLGHHLRSLGVGPETVVGISMKRGCDLVIAMMGVWKAGGAYLPMDHGYPKERLEFIVRDAGVEIVLTQGVAVHLSDGVTPLTVDRHAWGYFEAYSPTVPVSGARPENLAHILYTSGSTGAPKGVLLEHRNLARYIHRINGFTWGPRLRTLHYSPVSFDAHTYEIWAAVLNGGTSVMADEGPTVEAIRAGVREYGANAMWMASSFFNQMVDAGQLDGWPEVSIAVGGEAVSAAHVAKAYQRSDHIKLVNIYGPTETSVKATTYPLDRENAYRSTVPIGTPLPNVRAYVLGPSLDVLPVGAVGELCLGGEGVARGYLHRPELTAERFVQDPFRPGGRMYRTGDFVRWTADGLLDFVGRDDDQVKINGYRVELGEIEAVLADCPGVQRGCVVVREDQPGDRRLVAYFVPAAEAGDPDEAAREVRRHVAGQLPAYMMPSRFVSLDQIPQNDRGKLDRSALPAPSGSGGTTDRPVTAPNGPAETAVAELWCQLFALPHIDVRQNFMDLGGNSLMLLRLLVKVRQRFELDAIPPTLFHARTIHDMASLLQAETA
ncbi:non-ribosomal peptide synthetase [Streptomyces goshikiensis]|uniref:non-ribosomal peptide synthetase n=1 Tax=Streptomyces goshikiensis TaxID=1942 RepID=UPI0036CFC77D